MKHATNNIFVFILLLFTVESYSQTIIKGTYSNLAPLQEHYNNYIFKNNKQFEYESGASVGKNYYAKGHYYIKDNYLFLNYNLSELKQNSYHFSKNYYNSNDSIQLTFRIYDFDKNPLDRIQVYSFLESKHVGDQSNKSGFAELRYKKKGVKDVAKIYIDGEFLARHIIYLNLDRNHIIDVFLNKSEAYGFGHPKAIKHQIDTLKIKEFGKDYFTVLNKQGKEITWRKIK